MDKMKCRFTPVILAALAALPTPSKADFAFECTFQGSVFGNRDFLFYSETCTQFGCTDCKAYEVLCTSSGPTIEKTTLAYSEDCVGCLCNNASNWSFTGNFYGSALPDRQIIELPAYTELQSQAQISNSYEAQLLAQLSTVTENVIALEPNNASALAGGYPTFLTNSEVPAFTEANCPTGTSVNCALYYDSDWATEVRAAVSCAQAIAGNACYATHACACENSYYNIAETMPTFVTTQSTAYPDVISLAFADSGNEGGDTGTGDTGTGGETGTGQETGADDTGSGETGTGETGADNTGSGETGTGETGADDTGSGETGTGETGADDTGSGETGTGETGADDTGGDTNDGNDQTDNSGSTDTSDSGSGASTGGDNDTSGNGTNDGNDQTANSGSTDTSDSGSSGASTGGDNDTSGNGQSGNNGNSEPCVGETCTYPGLDAESTSAPKDPVISIPSTRPTQPTSSTSGSSTTTQESADGNSVVQPVDWDAVTETEENEALSAGAVVVIVGLAMLIAGLVAWVVFKCVCQKKPSSSHLVNQHKVGGKMGYPNVQPARLPSQTQTISDIDISVNDAGDITDGDASKQNIQLQRPGSKQSTPFADMIEEIK